MLAGPGDKVRCIKAAHHRLTLGSIYTVINQSNMDAGKFYKIFVGDNICGGEGTFFVDRFEVIVEPVMRHGAEEYDEIMAAQELMKT